MSDHRDLSEDLIPTAAEAAKKAAETAKKAAEERRAAEEQANTGGPPGALRFHRFTSYPRRKRLNHFLGGAGFIVRSLCRSGTRGSSSIRSW